MEAIIVRVNETTLGIRWSFSSDHRIVGAYRRCASARCPQELPVPARFLQLHGHAPAGQLNLMCHTHPHPPNVPLQRLRAIVHFVGGEYECTTQTILRLLGSSVATVQSAPLGLARLNTIFLQRPSSRDTRSSTGAPHIYIMSTCINETEQICTPCLSRCIR